jgi:carboxyl-terminal processing protease
MSTSTLRGFAIGLLVGALIGIYAGTRADRVEPFEGLLGADRTLSEEALDVIETNYFKDPDETKLEEGSVNAMIQELRKQYEDRFSHYFNPRQLRRFNQSTSGRFSGIGLSVLEVRKGLRVATVFPDTPAQEAGIREGDVIVSVDGRKIAGEPADAATARIKGPPGTEVRIGVLDADTGEVRQLEIERAEVRVPAVRGMMREADGVPLGYVQLAGFSEGANDELRDEIERLVERGAQGLVLDLRGNGGGLLDEAVLTSSVFIEDGVVVSTSGRAQPDRDYEAVGGAIDPPPMVVLIDRNTASAAEILAAALEEYDIATLVGTETFGKGTFQEVIELDEGGALSLTVGEYLTASGESLAGDGIEPEVRVRDNRATESDEALRRALRVLASELPASQE